MRAKVFTQSLATGTWNDALNVLQMPSGEHEEITYIPQGQRIEFVELQRLVQSRRHLSIYAAKACTGACKVNAVREHQFPHYVLQTMIVQFEYQRRLLVVFSALQHCAIGIRLMPTIVGLHAQTSPVDDMIVAAQRLGRIQCIGKANEARLGLTETVGSLTAILGNDLAAEELQLFNAAKSFEISLQFRCLDLKEVARKQNVIGDGIKCFPLIHLIRNVLQIKFLHHYMILCVSHILLEVIILLRGIA